MSDDRFQFFGRRLSCVAQIDFMMETLIRDIERITLIKHIFVHEGDSLRLAVFRIGSPSPRTAM